jgi:hypothetical protein
MNDDPMTVMKAGDSFYEAPGCRHRISNNASQTEEARFIANLILETEKMDALMEESGPSGLVVIDEEYKDKVLGQMKLQAELAKCSE